MIINSMKKPGAVVVLTVIILIGGCGAHRVPVNENVLMDKEQVTFIGFRNIATSSAVRTDVNRLPTGQLRVRVQLVKDAFDSVFVEIKVFFVDRANFQIESTNWEPIQLQRDVITQYETVSLSREAVDFRMVVRRPL